jgi:hypothetical protein
MAVATASPHTRVLRLVGSVPPELWNRLGTKLLPKLRAGTELRVGIDFSVVLRDDSTANVLAEVRQILQDLGLSDAVRIE